MDSKFTSSYLLHQIYNTSDDKFKPRHHVLATPVVDVFSVSIQINRKFDEQAQRSLNFEIYGHIRVINTRLGCDAEPLSLFHRDENNPHHTYVDSPLPLKCSSPINPSNYTHLDVLLYDRNANNMVVAQGRIILDIKSDDTCQEGDDYVESVFGDDKLTFARIEYSVMSYSSAKMINLIFLNDDDAIEYYHRCAGGYDRIDQIYDYDRPEREDGGVIASVFGSVSAFCNVTKEKKNRSISLFSKSSEKAVRVKSGDFIPLSRSLVIVPAYSSSLAVEVNLSSLGNNNNKPLLLAKGILEFRPEYKWTYKDDLDGEHGRVRVRVTWNHAYDQQFYHEKKQEYQDVKPSFDSNRLEVFSVAVHSKDSTDFSFYGTVDVKDGNEYCMYRKDKSCPQAAGPGALAPLKGPHTRSIWAGDYFYLRVHLKDGTTGGELSDGQLEWDIRLISGWNERRLCSVIPGEHGFAAVHYTAFCTDYVDSARVNVKIYGEQLPGYVYGKIVARYTTYEYSSAYEKKYYQSILYDRESEADNDNGLQPAAESGSDLPLLKSVVCLPVDSNLVIEFDLAVASQPSLDGSDYRQGAALLKGIVELSDDQYDLQQLNVNTFRIEVSMTILSWKAQFEFLS